MSSEVPTSRGRARPIRDRNYFKEPTPVSARTRNVSLILGGIGAVAVVVAFWPSAAARVGSPGSVSSAHATWEHRCDACHVSWRPISGGRPSAGWLGRPLRSHANRCETCHTGTPHFADQAPETNDCASCHVEHRGREAKLTRPPDSACLSCHGKKDGTHPHATDFAKDHPPFASPGRFERKLKFSHAVHLAPGMALAGEAQARPKTLEYIRDATARQKFADAQRAFSDKDLIQLDCARCHQLQSADGSAGPAPLRSDGRYFAPVRFEAHCRACHPLDAFDPRLNDVRAPHGGTADELRQFLNRTYADEWGRGCPQLLDFAQPGPRLDRPTRLNPLAKQEQIARVATAEVVLLKSGKGCAQCHLIDANGGIVSVVPKQVWFESVRFDHRAHRAADCRECHAGAFAEPKPDAALVELEPSLVGDIEGCRRCHAPVKEVDGVSRGGAGYSCTECHTYHGRGPHRGPAAPHRDPDKRLSVDAFLRGGR